MSPDNEKFVIVILICDALISKQIEKCLKMMKIKRLLKKPNALYCLDLSRDFSFSYILLSNTTRVTNIDYFNIHSKWSL